MITNIPLFIPLITTAVVYIATMNIGIPVVVFAVALLSQISPHYLAIIAGRNRGLDPDNFVTINNETFYISDMDNTTALEARELCNEGDMKLISFDTEEKYLMIVDYIANHTAMASVPFWSSGRQILSSWEWSSIGRLFRFVHWHAGQPDGASCDDQCVLWRSNAESGRWFDSPCVLRRGFVCEY